jgi:hypothetical protein
MNSLLTKSVRNFFKYIFFYYCGILMGLPLKKQVFRFNLIGCNKGLFLYVNLKTIASELHSKQILRALYTSVPKTDSKQQLVFDINVH